MSPKSQDQEVMVTEKVGVKILGLSIQELSVVKSISGARFEVSVTTWEVVSMLPFDENAVNKIV